jgi:hypothetical protein
MARWPEDEVDRACQAWAYQWVQHFARDPDRAARYIGPVGCTLGRVRTMGDGASSTTERGGQHFPEVYLGDGLLVAVVLQSMAQSHREVIWAHYVWRVWNPETWAPLRRPLKQIRIAQRLGVSLPEYYHRRDAAKSSIRCAMSIDTKLLDQARLRVAQSRKVAEVSEQTSRAVSASP